MLKRTIRIAGYVIALVILASVSFLPTASAGYSNSVESKEHGRPLSDVPNTQAMPLKDADDELLELAKANPGFAGSYRGDDGETVLFHTRPGSAAAMAMVEEVSPGATDPKSEEWPGRASHPVRVLPAAYDFAQLHAWKQQARHLLSRDGVVSIDINELENRVEVGLADWAALPFVEELRKAAGIPADALHAKSDAFDEPVQATLDDPIGPIRGGLLISSSEGFCTLGVNASIVGLGEGFITNSHCTELTGILEGTVFYQPLPDYRIGFEARDPAAFTGGPCSPGRICRYSDAAFIKYDSGTHFSRGSIYRTLGRGQASQSVVIDNNDPILEITWPLELVRGGDVVDKIGQATGWTTGPVAYTCVDRNSTDGSTYLCQHMARLDADYGDSGAAVFRYDLGYAARPMGLVWGTTNATGYDSDELMTFSPWAYVAAELGFGNNSDLDVVSDCSSSDLSWSHHGGVLASGTSAVSTDSSMHVFGSAYSGNVYERSYGFGAWSAWANLGKPSGVNLTHTPGSVEWPPGTLNVFARGSNGAVYHAYDQGSGWSGWNNIGGLVQGGISAVSLLDHQLHVFAVANNGKLYVNPYTVGSGWGGWTDLGRPGTTNLSMAPGVLAHNGVIDVYVRDSTSALRRRYWDPDTGWSGWQSLGGSLDSGPTAVSIDSQAVVGLDVHVFAAANGKLFRRSWLGGWTGWVDHGHPAAGSVTGQPGAAAWSDGTVHTFPRAGADAVWQSRHPCLS